MKSKKVYPTPATASDLKSDMNIQLQVTTNAMIEMLTITVLELILREPIERIP